MPIHNDGLEQELQWVTKPFEVKHIRGLFEETTPLMHDIAYNLITGAHFEVDRLVQEALAEGYSANDVLDDGLISGMAVVGIKFRDNIIFVPEVLVAARAMKAGMVYIEPYTIGVGHRAYRHGDYGHGERRPARHRQEPVHHDAARGRLHRSRPRRGYEA